MQAPALWGRLGCALRRLHFGRAAFATACVLAPIQAMAKLDCEALAGLSLPRTVVISSTDSAAGPPKLLVPGVAVPGAAVEQGGASAAVTTGARPYIKSLYGPGIDKDLPAFCRVTLRVDPQIYIEVWLPKENWNERFRGEGGGGYAGWVNYAGMADALRAGYATASTDTGHAFYMKGAFVLNADRSRNQQLLDDFAWRSVQEMTLKAKAIIRSYYGIPPRYSYWRGCSTGGRQGLLAVQRFPGEYDGVLAGSPGINFDRAVPATLWPHIVMQEEVGHPISMAKLDKATKSAIAACDPEDGVIDGIVNAPRRCHYDPAELVCSNVRTEADCLSAAEAKAIRRIWEGPKTRDGRQIWFGPERGASLAVQAGAQPFSMATDYFSYWIKRDPAFDWRKLGVDEFAQSVRDSVAEFNGVIGTDNPNLENWKARRGKLIIWQDEKDEIVSPRATIDYFNKVLATNHGAGQVAEFARLYMVPGSRHCATDDQAPFPYQIFDSLVNWVEKGVAPDRLIASQRLPDGALRTRPLCPYPDSARWNGEESPDDARNYTCVLTESVPVDSE